MNPRMAGLAQRHKVSLVMRPALCQWQLMAYFLYRPQQPLLLALLAEQVLCGVAVTDSFPCPSVSLGQPGKEHGLFGFLGICLTSSRHKESPRRILLLPRRLS